jgi:ADP-ribose pyrophosphatase
MSWHREELLKDDGLKETQLSSEQRYDGYFMNVQRDTVELPNGQTSTREYMKHPGAVMIIPVFDNGDVLLERQFRYPLHQVFVELPAGKMDGGE